jgi:hypothetical protein
MGMSECIPHQCKCAQKLSLAETSLRTRGNNNPKLASQYFAAAAEVKRVVLEHFRGCVACQAAEVDEKGSAAA